MILNELTNEDALQAIREQTWEEAQQYWEVERQHWEAAQQQYWEVERQHWEKAQQQHWEAERQQVFDLIDQGLTGEQLKQALQRERLRIVPQTTKTEGSKR